MVFSWINEIAHRNERGRKDPPTPLVSISKIIGYKIAGMDVVIKTRSFFNDMLHRKNAIEEYTPEEDDSLTEDSLRNSNIQTTIINLIQQTTSPRSSEKGNRNLNATRKESTSHLSHRGDRLVMTHKSKHPKSSARIRGRRTNATKRAARGETKNSAPRIKTDKLDSSGIGRNDNPKQSRDVSSKRSRSSCSKTTTVNQKLKESIDDPSSSKSQSPKSGINAKDESREKETTNEDNPELEPKVGGKLKRANAKFQKIRDKGEKKTKFLQVLPYRYDIAKTDNTKEGSTLTKSLRTRHLTKSLGKRLTTRSITSNKSSPHVSSKCEEASQFVDTCPGTSQSKSNQSETKEQKPNIPPETYVHAKWKTKEGKKASKKLANSSSFDKQAVTSSVAVKRVEPRTWASVAKGASCTPKSEATETVAKGASCTPKSEATKKEEQQNKLPAKMDQLPGGFKNSHEFPSLQEAKGKGKRPRNTHTVESPYMSFKRGIWGGCSQPALSITEKIKKRKRLKKKQKLKAMLTKLEPAEEPTCTRELGNSSYGSWYIDNMPEVVTQPVAKVVPLHDTNARHMASKSDICNRLNAISFDGSTESPHAIDSNRKRKKANHEGSNKGPKILKNRTPKESGKGTAEEAGATTKKISTRYRALLRRDYGKVDVKTATQLFNRDRWVVGHQKDKLLDRLEFQRQRRMAAKPSEPSQPHSGNGEPGPDPAEGTSKTVDWSRDTFYFMQPPQNNGCSTM